MPGEAVNALQHENTITVHSLIAICHFPAHHPVASLSILTADVRRLVDLCWGLGNGDVPCGMLSNKQSKVTQVAGEKNKGDRQRGKIPRSTAISRRTVNRSAYALNALKPNPVHLLL